MSLSVWNDRTCMVCELVLILLFLGFLPGSVAEGQDKPDVMLSEIYRQGVDISQYWVSEKLDGVRARWDGAKLISRGGHVFSPPEWFTEGVPRTPLDGELWMARGEYDQTSSIVRKKAPHEGWKAIRFMIFDLPHQGGTFTQRVLAMNQLIEQVDAPYLGMIDQHLVKSEAELREKFQAVLDLDGEGLMLHRKTAQYTNGRTHDLLKLKPYIYAEAIVIGYREGKGQFAGQVGSLKVRTDQGVIIYVGSGLTNEDRGNPPPVGSQITFRYQGLTKNGVPRFPVFLRVRRE